MMYKYAPEPRRRKEKLLLAASLILGGASFSFSLLEWISYPALYQLAAFACFTASVMLLSRYLLRDYVYCVEPRNGIPEAPLDLTVTEALGRRSTVVCRIALSDIREAVRITAENRKVLAAQIKGKRVFVYTPEMSPLDCLLLTVEDGESVYFVKICADEALYSAILGL